MDFQVNLNLLGWFLVCVLLESFIKFPVNHYYEPLLWFMIKDDWISTNCYNTHCSIIKSIIYEQTGSNEMLAKAFEVCEVTGNTHNTTKATLSSMIFVAKHLLPQKAVVLLYYQFQCTPFLYCITK